MRENGNNISLMDSRQFNIDETGRSIGIFSSELPICVDWKLIEELKEIATSSTDKNVRLCLHSNPDALFHTMIIVEKQGKYYPPHRHVDKGECFHIIKGSMGIFSFDIDGVVIDCARLEPMNNFIYRVAENMYHSVIPLTPVVVYHESKVGPFRGRKDSIVAPWAPDGSDTAENEEYYSILLRELS